MTRGKIIDQVHGILAGERLVFDVADNGRGFHVPVPQGSAAIEIDFQDWVRGRTVIRLRAHVLEQVDVREDNRLNILEHLNALNQTSLFGRFYLDADRSTVILEHELLGDHLDAGELMNGLYTLGILADQTDDDLQRALGTGRRAVELPPAADGPPAWRWWAEGEVSGSSDGPLA